MSDNYLERLLFSAIAEAIENAIPELPEKASISSAIEMGVEAAILSIFSDLNLSRAEMLNLITGAISEGARQALKEGK